MNLDVLNLFDVRVDLDEALDALPPIVVRDRTITSEDPFRIEVNGNTGVDIVSCLITSKDGKPAAIIFGKTSKCLVRVERCDMWMPGNEPNWGSRVVSKEVL